MPSDISTLATIMSMIRNGMKIRKPIWNAVFSSLATKAGTSTLNGTASPLTSAGSLASLANSCTSDWRVCLSMNTRIGAWPFSSASLKLIWLAWYGAQASV